MSYLALEECVADHVIHLYLHRNPIICDRFIRVVHGRPAVQILRGFRSHKQCMITKAHWQGLDANVAHLQVSKCELSLRCVCSGAVCL